MDSYIRDHTLLLDFQYVRGNGDQIFVKELGFLFANSIVPRHFVFKPPYDEAEVTKKIKKQNNFNFLYINGLHWNDGNVEYSKLADLLNFDESVLVLVKGTEKKKFLEKYISNVQEIDMPGKFTDYDLFHHNCATHLFTHNRCVLNHIFQMLIYLEKNNKFFTYSTSI